MTVGFGPLVQPAVAQQATPTPLPTAVPISNISPNTQVQPTATPQAASVISVDFETGGITGTVITPTPVPTPTPNGIEVHSCGGASRIFQGCPIGGPTELGLETQAINTVLQEHQLPASDQSRVLGWARDDVRAALFANLVAAFQKDPSKRTVDEQTAVSSLTKLVQQKHIQSATVAQNEYNKWAGNFCVYTPPPGFTYSAASACASAASRAFAPASPGLQAFEAYGVVAAYQNAKYSPSDLKVYGSTAGALALAYGYAAAVGAGAVGAAVGTIVPISVLAAIQPFAAGALAFNTGLAAGDAVAAGALPAGVIGAVSIGSTVLIVVGAVVTAVVAGIEVFQEAAIPSQLQTALNTAQTYDIGSAIRSTDTATSAAAQQELYGEFIGLTLPDSPATGSAPAAQPGDKQLLVNGSPASSMTYTAWDKSKHTARLSGGWLVDTDASGKSILTLSIDYLDLNGKSWIVSPIGSKFLIADPSDPSTAGFAQPSLVTGFPFPPVSSDVRLVEMNQTGSGKTEVHILTAGSNYAQVSLEVATALDMSTASQWAFAFAPNADLYAIKLNNTGSGHTEVHILTAASGYQQFSLHTATALAEANPSNWTFQVGSGGDLYAMTTKSSASGKVEVHILTAASNYQRFSNEVATALGAVDPTKWEFRLTSANDLVGVFLSGTASGQTEVHILSAASNYQQYRLEVPTPIGPTNRAAWQFGMGANDDLLGIFRDGTASATTEVHRLSASSNYRQFNLEVPTVLQQEKPGLWNFGVGSLVY